MNTVRNEIEAVVIAKAAKYNNSGDWFVIIMEQVDRCLIAAEDGGRIKSSAAAIIKHINANEGQAIINKLDALYFYIQGFNETD